MMEDINLFVTETIRRRDMLSDGGYNTFGRLNMVAAIGEHAVQVIDHLQVVMLVHPDLVEALRALTAACISADESGELPSLIDGLVLDRAMDVLDMIDGEVEL